MNKTLSTLFCCLLAVATVQAQSLTGKLIDEHNHPLPFANIVLLSLPDSAFVAGTVSGDDGTFALEATCRDRLIRISSIGYTTLYKPCTGQDLGTLQLQPDAQMLGEVVVKAELPKVRIKGDAQVTTVQGSILEQAGTGNDLLNKLPGVSADDGTVNVFGSGTAEIYINGRKMRDASELDQLESDNIKRVEVVRNPGARYDATVQAVVRIYTKKPQGEGFGVNNRFLVRHYYKMNVLDQFNFNYRKGGFDLSGMVFGSRIYGEENKTLITETFLDKTWRQESDLHTDYTSVNLSAMLSLNYQFNENHSVGARYDYDRTPKDKLNFNPMQSDVFQDDALYEQNTTNGWQKNPSTSHTLNIYYNGQAGDWNIDFNADGLWSYSKTLQDMNERYIPTGEAPQEQRVTSYNKDENTLYAAKLIISRPLWEGNLSFGGEYTYTDHVNTYINDQGFLDDDHSNIRENETYLTVNMGTPISYNSSVLAEFGFTVGSNQYVYFPADNYTQYDREDRTRLSYATTRLKMAQTTLDYNMYPSSGRRRLLEFRYIFSHEGHTEGTMFADGTTVSQPFKHTLLARLNFEDYYDLGRWFSLGYNIDLTVSTALNLCDYTSTMTAMPAFQPTVHSKTLMLGAYRAPIYVGAMLTPVIKFTKTLFLHLSGGYFQPYRALEETAGGRYQYSDIFPRGSFIGHAALVWQSPIGPLSLSCAYYEGAERTKWYPSFNIGFLIFREHGLKN